MSPVPRTPRRRPPWWPENEPWPPHRNSFRQHRGSFFRRIGCLFMLVMLVGVTLFALALALLSHSLGLVEIAEGGIPWMIPLSALLFIFLLGSLAQSARWLKRFSRPFDELVQAADRVAEGDYSARVAESGPSDVRSLAQAFNKMAARLQKADQQRRDLLVDASHELRTPLTVIQGNLEGMLDGLYSPDEDRLRSLLDETQVLERLINDLRILSLADSGALELRREPVDLAELIEHTLAVFSGQSTENGIRFFADIQPDLPRLYLDPERIRQVIHNLIANSIRYTPKGGEIRIACRQLGIEDGNRLLVSVTDTGPGIAPDELLQIFDRFYKSRDSGGMGLGLSIARSLVELHGGAIQAESTPGHGTQISFTLPFQRP